MEDEYNITTVYARLCGLDTLSITVYARLCGLDTLSTAVYARLCGLDTLYTIHDLDYVD